MGFLLGLRGNKEHTFMKLSQICKGFFRGDHPLFANYEYWGISHFDSDKTHKIGKKSGYVREVENWLGRFPVTSDGKTGDVARDFGGALKRLVQKIPAHITINRLYLRISKDGKTFVNAPLGEKTIRSRFVKAFSVCGISNPDTLWPHALRAHFTTKLANDMGVSMKETMAAARHSTAEASAMYQTTSAVSEAHRHNALLGPPPKNKANDSLARSRNEVVLDDSDDDFVPKPKRKSNNSLARSRKKVLLDDSDDDFVRKPEQKSNNSFVTCRKTRIREDSDDDFVTKPKRRSKKKGLELNLMTIAVKRILRKVKKKCLLH